MTAHQCAVRLSQLRVLRAQERVLCAQFAQLLARRVRQLFEL
eukprot:CAMPEP_0179470178 /NCGR_PEP_ID=MMETSP0799-20121207/50677_1 /TAXON_ID=46947 /ORGANISM="Geminigera cryophila, Strain CCMP2564" /LENGTH=41 /DNA_ID= /DNA_START= /DNA_END= /DNA_ORIENTATION=